MSNTELGTHTINSVTITIVKEDQNSISTYFFNAVRLSRDGTHIGTTGTLNLFIWHSSHARSVFERLSGAGKTFSKDAEMFTTCLKTNGRFFYSKFSREQCPKQEYEDGEDYSLKEGRVASHFF